MKMKSVVLVAMATIAYLGVQAQASGSTKANPGGIYIKGGLNLSNISTNSDGTVNNAKTLATWNAGIIGDIPLLPVLSLQTGLLLNAKGAKTEYYADDNNHDDNYVKARFNPLYLELPVNFVLKFPMGPNARLFVGAGPYVAMGIGGKTKVTTKLAGVSSTSSETIKFNNDDPTTGGQENSGFDRVRKFDYGLNALAGVEVGKIALGVNYGYGLAKINSNGDNSSNDKNKYRMFSLNIGFKL